MLALLICWGSVVWSRWSPARQDKTQKQIERAMGPCVHLFKPTLGRVLALVVDVVGIVIFSVGWACLNGSLVGVEDCKATGIVFIFLGHSLLVCGVLSTYFMHQWNQMLSFSAALKNVAKRTSFIAGELLVALGIVLMFAIFASFGFMLLCCRKKKKKGKRNGVAFDVEEDRASIRATTSLHRRAL